MDNIYSKTSNILKRTIPSCQSDVAWQNVNGNIYKKCTKDMGMSSGLTMEELEVVENFVTHNLNTNKSSEVQIGQLIDGGQYPLCSNKIHKALKFMRDSTSVYGSQLTCGK